MARTLTNKTSFLSAVETSLGTAGTTWREIEVNTISTLGATVTNTPRSPITKDRQDRKGSTTDLDSAFSFDADLTLSHLVNYIESFCYASFYHCGTQGVAVYTPTAVVDGGGSPDEYTVAADGDLAAGELIYARGFDDPENNGLKLVVSTSTATAIKVATGTLVADASPATNVEVAVCGVQGGTSDIVMTSGGDLTSTVLDFTTLGLNVGQFIKIGGTATDTYFATAANNNYARIAAIAANQLTLDKPGGTFAADAGTSKTIQLFYGRFLKNVDVDHAKFIERSHTFEVTYDSISAGPVDEYEYPVGNYANELTINLPLTDKATANFAFVGTDTETPVLAASRKSGASTPIAPNMTELLNTSADIARLRITQTDETGALTDFKNVTLKISNNVAPEKVLGTLGAAYMDYGNFMVSVDATMLFTDDSIVEAVRNNDTMTMDFILQNSDGAVAFDLPSVTIGDGGREFPINESITVKAAIKAFKDPTLDTSIGISLFPHIPT
jgi:hypothetical protein